MLKNACDTSKHKFTSSGRLSVSLSDENNENLKTVEFENHYASVWEIPREFEI